MSDEQSHTESKTKREKGERNEETQNNEAKKNLHNTKT